MLAGVVAADGAVPGHPAAGKTGTQQYLNTSDTQDAWMAGYTPELAAVVWLGRPKPSPIRDIAGHPIEGDGLPATLWRSFLSAALAGTPAGALPAPANLGRTDTGDAEPLQTHRKPTGWSGVPPSSAPAHQGLPSPTPTGQRSPTKPGATSSPDPSQSTSPTPSGTPPA